MPFCFQELLFSWTYVLGIHKYQDQVQELSSQVTQPIKDALEPLGPYLGEAKDKILVFLGDIKEKVMSLPLAVWIGIMFMFLLAGKFARILTDFFDFPKFCFFAFRNCRESIRIVHLSKAKILGFLSDFKERVMSSPLGHFSFLAVSTEPKSEE